MFVEYENARQVVSWWIFSKFFFFFFGGRRIFHDRKWDLLNVTIDVISVVFTYFIPKK